MSPNCAETGFEVGDCEAEARRGPAGHAIHSFPAVVEYKRRRVAPLRGIVVTSQTSADPGRRPVREHERLAPFPAVHTI